MVGISDAKEDDDEEAGLLFKICGCARVKKVTRKLVENDET